MVIDKPEKLLLEKLKSKTTTKSLSKSSNNFGSYSAQSTQSCYTLEIDVWAFTKYEARAGKEFGILPHPYRQYAGGSGDANRIQKLNELKSKWGFNYILASIGNYETIMAIVNAGFPIATNFMGGIQCNQEGKNSVLNIGNGLNANTYFWAYYTDEPSSEQNVTEWELFTLDTLVKNQRPNSLFGFGETWLGAVYKYTNRYYRTRPNFVMCTKYFNDELEQNRDQRGRWTDFRIGLQSTFSKTWIAAHKDGSEFNNLLGYCRDYNIAPWFYQLQDFEDSSEIMISSYCYNGYLTDFLRRYEKKFIYVYYYIGFDDPCSDYQITSWELGDIIETTETRILNP